MLVENVVEFVHAKFANLCAHLEETYCDVVDTAAMRAVPPTALFVLLRTQLLPHAALIKAGHTAQLAAQISEPPSVAALVRLCIDDPKVLRYLKLFCELVA
jgi:hypothetical protein